MICYTPEAPLGDIDGQSEALTLVLLPFELKKGEGLLTSVTLFLCAQARKGSR